MEMKNTVRLMKLSVVHLDDGLQQSRLLSQHILHYMLETTTALLTLLPKIISALFYDLYTYTDTIVWHFQ